MLLPLRLKYEPVFNVGKDIEQIKAAVLGEKEGARKNVLFFPTARAYVLTDRLDPVAIFDKLDHAGFYGLLKLALCVAPEHIDNPNKYADVEVMNVLRKAVHTKGFKRPYTVAVFVADKVIFHLKISVDLLVVVCDRLKDHDIVNRDFWEFIYDSTTE